MDRLEEDTQADRVTTLPRRGAFVEKYVTDDLALLARQQPGAAILVQERAPLSMAKAIRQRTREPYVGSGEHRGWRIFVHTRNKVEVDGETFVDIYFTWEKREKGRR